MERQIVRVTVMLLLPIVDRELRVASRQTRTYLSRVMAGVAGLAMSFYLVWVAQMTMGGAWAGIFILKATSYMAWALCILVGLGRTCDSLSAEKRADTLGLLFLTQLKGHDVVLGKLLANCLGAFFLLLGLTPIFSVPILLGGVSGAELTRIPLVLLNSLLLSASIGLLGSSLVRGQRAASALAGGVMVFLAVLLPAAAPIVEREVEWPELARIMRIPSPLSLMETAFSSSVGLANTDFWKSLFVQFLMALTALAGACWAAPRSWRIKNSVFSRWSEKFNAWSYGNERERRVRRTKFLERNPFFWLGCRDRFAPMWPVITLVATAVPVLWCIVYYEIPKPPAFGLLLATIAVNDLIHRMRVANLGAARLANDRHSGALEIVMSTTLTINEVTRGIWMSIRRIELPAYIALITAYIVVASAFGYVMEGDFDHFVVFFTFAFVSIGDFLVLGYVAMWKGMLVTNPRHCAGSAMLRVAILPWALWLLCLPVIGEVRVLRAWFDAWEPYSFSGLALIIWAISSGTALLTARRNLHRYFHEAITDRETFERRFRLSRRLGFIKRWATEASNRKAVPHHTERHFKPKATVARPDRLGLE